VNLAYAVEAQQAFKKMSKLARFRMRVLGTKIRLGYEKRDGWSGFLPFYLFWCKSCKHYAKDYPHGFIERRYLLCSSCNQHYSFIPWWVPLAVLWNYLKFILVFCRLSVVPRGLERISVEFPDSSISVPRAYRVTKKD